MARWNQCKQISATYWVKYLKTIKIFRVENSVVIPLPNTKLSWNEGEDSTTDNGPAIEPKSQKFYNLLYQVGL
jgi:hypothetical protein